MFEEPFDYLFLIIVTVPIVGCIVSYSAKILAKNNGLKINWFSGPFRDFSNMSKLIRNGKTQRVKLLAKVHLILLIIFPIILLSIFIIAIYISINEPALVQSIVQSFKSRNDIP